MIAKTNLNQPRKVRLYCNKCKGETNHICKGEHLCSYGNEGMDEEVCWRLWICNGCEEGMLEETYSIHNKDPESGEFLDDPLPVGEIYYPPRNGLQLHSKSFVQLPNSLDNIYREILGAFNNDLGVLCAVGVRTLIEGICINKGVTGNNLASRIDGLAAILPQNILNGLHSIRFIGNTATHQLTAPENEELRLAIEICEDLLNFLYDLDYKSRRLAAVQQGKRLFSPRPVTEAE